MGVRASRPHNTTEKQFAIQKYAMDMVVYQGKTADQAVKDTKFLWRMTTDKVLEYVKDNPIKRK